MAVWVGEDFFNYSFLDYYRIATDLAVRGLTHVKE